MTIAGELPDCQRLVIFDGRFVGLHDARGCSESWPGRYCVGANIVAGWRDRCGGRRTPYGVYPSPGFDDLITDDPDEAEAAFVRGEHWVRTNQLPEEA